MHSLLKQRAAELSFNSLAEFLEDLSSHGRSHKRKVARLRHLFDVRLPRCCGDDLFHVFRLMLPKLDHERGYYGIKEKRLAGLLVAALGACRERAAAAKDWPRLAHETHSKFPTVMQKVLLDYYCPAAVPPERGCLTLAMVNAGLDQLAAIAGRAGTRGAAAPGPPNGGGDDEGAAAAAAAAAARGPLSGEQATAQQTEVLRGLLRLCTPLAARWLLYILLKYDLPIGLGDRAVLTAFHPEAHDAFASCSDLRLVLSGLCRPGSTWRRRDVQPGLNVSPQLAARCGGGPAEAAALMRGRPFVVETKFDGWRIQLHVTGADPRAGDAGGGRSGFHYFSRNLKDHGKRSSFAVLDRAVTQFLRPTAGELVSEPMATAAATAASATAAAGAETPKTPGAGAGSAEAVASAAVAAAGGSRVTRSGPMAPGLTLSFSLPLCPVVLDGEMLVWNKKRCRFEPFGMLEATIKAAAEGWGPEDLVKGRELAATGEEYEHPLVADLEVVYVAFDILYLRDTSVVHLPLKERHRLLGTVLRPLSGDGGLAGGVPVGQWGAVTFRAEALLPGRPMFDGKVHSWVCSTKEEVQELYDMATADNEEGIVVKALEEPYRLRSRTEAWLKLKPDYLTQGEFDAVILGQMFDHTRGQTSVGGVYLLGLPEEPQQPGKPTTYVTFATVGTGVSKGQRKMLLEPMLAGNLVASRPAQGQGAERRADDDAGGSGGGGGGGGRAARLRGVPRWCRATGSKDEWPDWWVLNPDKSVVVQVNADVRPTRTSVFAAGHTLRFPRITRIRTDKSPAQATTLAELREVVRRAAAREVDRGSGAGEVGGAKAGGVAATEEGARGTASTSKAVAAAVASTAASCDMIGGGRRVRPGAPRKPLPRQRRPPVSRVPLHLLAPDVSEVPVHFDVLHGAYVVLEGLYGATAAERRGELSRLVRLLGGRCSANYVNRGECRTSYVIVDEWVETCHGGDTRDLLRPAWLEECYIRRRLVMPPMPSHAWRLSAETLASYADVLDKYGDPYYELLDERDLAAVLEYHVDQAVVRQARQAFAEPEGAGLRQRQRCGQWTRGREAAAMAAPGSLRVGASGARMQSDMSTSRPSTPDAKLGASTGCPSPAPPASQPVPLTATELLHWLEGEMLAEGESPPDGIHRLFSGAVVLMLDVTAAAGAGASYCTVRSMPRLSAQPTPPPPLPVAQLNAAPALDDGASHIGVSAFPGAAEAEAEAAPPAGACTQTVAAAVPLLYGVGDAVSAAGRWAMEASRCQLEGLRLAVSRGGGRVAERWSPAVTHVVLYDGVVLEDGDDEARSAGGAGRGVRGRGPRGAGDGAHCDNADGCGSGDDAGAAEQPTSTSSPPAFDADRVLDELRSCCTAEAWRAASKLVQSCAANGDEGGGNTGSAGGRGGAALCESDGVCPWHVGTLDEGRSTLAQLVARLRGGVSGGGGDPGPPGLGVAAAGGDGARLVDWRWIRDSWLQAERAAAAADAKAAEADATGSPGDHEDPLLEPWQVPGMAPYAPAQGGAPPWRATGDRCDVSGDEAGGDGQDDDEEALGQEGRCREGCTAGTPPVFVALPEARYPPRVVTLVGSATRLLASRDASETDSEGSRALASALCPAATMTEPREAACGPAVDSLPGRGGCDCGPAAPLRAHLGRQRTLDTKEFRQPPHPESAVPVVVEVERNLGSVKQAGTLETRRWRALGSEQPPPLLPLQPVEGLEQPPREARHPHQRQRLRLQRDEQKPRSTTEGQQQQQQRQVQYLSRRMPSPCDAKTVLAERPRDMHGDKEAPSAQRPLKRKTPESAASAPSLVAQDGEPCRRTAQRTAPPPPPPPVSATSPSPSPLPLPLSAPPPPPPTAARPTRRALRLPPGMAFTTAGMTAPNTPGAGKHVASTAMAGTASSINRVAAAMERCHSQTSVNTSSPARAASPAGAATHAPRAPAPERPLGCCSQPPSSGPAPTTAERQSGGASVSLRPACSASVCWGGARTCAAGLASAGGLRDSAVAGVHGNGNSGSGSSSTKPQSCLSRLLRQVLDEDEGEHEDGVLDSISTPAGDVRHAASISCARQCSSLGSRTAVSAGTPGPSCALPARAVSLSGMKAGPQGTSPPLLLTGLAPAEQAAAAPLALVLAEPNPSDPALAVRPRRRLERECALTAPAALQAGQSSPDRNKAAPGNSSDGEPAASCLPAAGLPGAAGVQSKPQQRSSPAAAAATPVAASIVAAARPGAPVAVPSPTAPPLRDPQPGSGGYNNADDDGVTPADAAAAGSMLQHQQPPNGLRRSAPGCDGLEEQQGERPEALTRGRSYGDVVDGGRAWACDHDSLHRNHCGDGSRLPGPSRAEEAQFQNQPLCTAHNPAPALTNHAAAAAVAAAAAGNGALVTAPAPQERQAGPQQPDGSGERKWRRYTEDEPALVWRQEPNHGDRGNDGSDGEEPEETRTPCRREGGTKRRRKRCRSWLVVLSALGGEELEEEA